MPAVRLPPPASTDYAFVTMTPKIYDVEILSKIIFPAAQKSSQTVTPVSFELFPTTDYRPYRKLFQCFYKMKDQ